MGLLASTVIKSLLVNWYVNLVHLQRVYRCIYMSCYHVLCIVVHLILHTSLQSVNQVYIFASMYCMCYLSIKYKWGALEVGTVVVRPVVGPTVVRVRLVLAAVAV